ncbi:hypothetical protein HDV05_006541 [Chytridiales sp. JEL 0842]|nr:hypothetical protein HDV05_006541 [Chytridiales sp. JEL 0842]
MQLISCLALVAALNAATVIAAPAPQVGTVVTMKCVPEVVPALTQTVSVPIPTATSTSPTSNAPVDTGNNNSTIIVANIPSTRPPPQGPIPRRTFHIVNNCSFPIRIGMTGGALPRAQCPQVANSPECTTSPAGDCFCGIPATQDQRNLAPKQTLKVDFVGDVSGNVYASTGCNGATCQSAVCDSGYCKPSTGPEGAVSLAEFTLNPRAEGTDFYDVSIIDGTNIPVTMGPLNQAGVGAPKARYDCGVAGGRGDWSFKPTVNNLDYSTSLRAVLPTGNASTPCKSDADCPTSTVCGFNLATNTPSVCGKKIGYLGLKHLCSLKLPNLQCDAPVRKGNLRQLLLCEGFYGQHSGYTQVNPSKTDACGCPNWQALSGLEDVAPEQACAGDNDQWQAMVFPWLQWMKRGVKDGYTFPYDDMTSTYTCNSNRAKDGYKIEFCPGNTEAAYF